MSFIPYKANAYEVKSNRNNEKSLIEDGTYIISSKRSGKSIEVANYGKSDGDMIQQWTYGGAEHQQWKIISVDCGYYKIVSNISGKVVQVKDSSKENVAIIDQGEYKGNDNQLWYFEKTEDSC